MATTVNCFEKRGAAIGPAQQPAGKKPAFVPTCDNGETFCGPKAVELKDAFYRLDMLDGRQDGMFDETIAVGSPVVTRIDLCAAAQKLAAVTHETEEARTKRYAKTANALLSFINLVGAKKGEVYPILNQLVIMQLGFAQFIGNSTGISDAEWERNIEPAKGKDAFWGAAARETIKPEGWRKTAWERTLPR